jgi:SAM-dependent methyltransferase
MSGDRPNSCGICGASEWMVAYDGPIRDGVFGRDRPGTVMRCGGCGVEVLTSPDRSAAAYYADGTYRADVGEGADAASFFERHDHEQFPRLAMLEQIPLRGRVVADVGAAGGSFLDGVRGFAEATIAIEPDRNYHESLKARGHRVFADTRAALADAKGRVDLAVCFSVIEHLDDPVALLADIRGLLAPSGVALVSTPNRDDVLLGAGCDAYRRFFYRVVHRYYFEAGSVRQAAQRAGFNSCQLVYKHRFPFSNFIAWLAEHRPAGRSAPSPLGDSFDRTWIAALEQSGRADYLYAFLRP